MASQSGLQGRQQRHPLFTQRGQIAANACKGLRSGHAAEAPGDFLLHFDHAQITLGQIVIKIHAQVFQEEENRLLMFAQAIQQIAGGTLLAASACAGRCQRMRMLPISFIEQFQEACLPIDDFQWVQPVLALRASSVACFISRSRSFRSAAQTAPVLLPERPDRAAHARCRRRAGSRTGSTRPIRRGSRCR